MYTRILRHFSPPLVIAAGSAFWLWKALDVARDMPLGGDHGIFQYVAWAMTQGERLYEGYREVNGPLTAVMHVLFQALGGSDDRVFRTLDLALNGLSFLIIGAALPGNVGNRRRPHDPVAPSPWLRAGFAIAAFAMLMSGYLRQGFWGTAQRESFALCFFLPSLALQVTAQAHYRSELSTSRQRRQRLLLTLSGVLGALVVLVKPTFGIFCLAQLLGLWVGAEKRERWPHLRWFVLGATGSLLACMVLLWPFVDFPRWLELLVEARAVYRFMWNGSLSGMWNSQWWGSHIADATLLVVLGIAGVAYGLIPRRLFVLMIAPFAAMLHITLQHKGFHYHYVPIIALTRVAYLTLVALCFEVAMRRVRDPWLGGLIAFVPVLAATVYTARDAAQNGTERLWVMRDEAKPQSKIGSKEYYKLFASRNTPFLEQHQAAAWLSEHTEPHERIQVYGRDPWVLFLARRLSATPYVYATDLNMRLSLKGSGGVVPNDQEKQLIREAGDAHDQDLLARVQKHKPAYFVFIDGTGLMPMPDAAKDFKRHVPKSGAWVFTHYQEVKKFGPIRIYGPKTAAVPAKIGVQVRLAP